MILLKVDLLGAYGGGVGSMIDTFFHYFEYRKNTWNI